MTSTAQDARSGVPGRAGDIATVSRGRRVARALVATAPIFLVLAIVLVLIALRAPRGADIEYYLRLLQRSAPLMILAAGQMYVIVSGEFDLSVGAIVSAVVVAAALLTRGDEALTFPVIGALLLFGAAVGIVNGFLTTRLRVPSFIATLGMAFVLTGGVAVWTKGAPRGSLPENLRAFGRETFEDVPLLGELPYAVLVLLVVGIAAYLLLHRTNFGRQLFAVGGNARAAALSGVRVSTVRTAAFVLSGISAIVAGILLAGIGGIANRAGEGQEFQAIAAVVLGGAALGGGRGSMLSALAAAFTLEAVFTLLLLYEFPSDFRYAIQGGVIIAAVAYASYRIRRAG